MVRYDIDKTMESLEPKEQKEFLENVAKDLKKRIKEIRKSNAKYNAMSIKDGLSDLGEGVLGLTAHNLPFLLSLACPILAVTCGGLPLYLTLAATSISFMVKGILTKSDKLDDQDWYVDCVRCADFSVASCKEDVKAVKQQIKEIEQMKKNIR